MYKVLDQKAKKIHKTLIILFLASMTTLGGCASSEDKSNIDNFPLYDEFNDPLEPFNRAMLEVDKGLNTIIFNPTIAAYEYITPEAGRKGVTNVLKNFRSPITLTNDILQGKPYDAGVIILRFIINSTIGVLGLFDIAEQIGLPYHYEDFGQTFALWGLGEGPYLFIPILGPSNFRDIAGYAIDTYSLDPMSWVSRANNPFWWQIGYSGVLTIDVKSQAKPLLEELERTSVDYYAALRSAYRQNRKKVIGIKEENQNYEEYSFE